MSRKESSLSKPLKKSHFERKFLTRFIKETKGSFSISIYKNLNEDIIISQKNSNISVVNQITNKLNTFITLGKHKISKSEKKERSL